MHDERVIEDLRHIRHRLDAIDAKLAILVDRVGVSLDALGALVEGTATTKEQIMATLEVLAAEVEKIEGVQDSAVATINGIAAELKDALAKAQLPPDQSATFQGLIDRLEASKQKLAAAIAANPVAPPAPAP